jgi:hypothetical protein
VAARAAAATAAATGSALVLFLLSRAIFQVPYDWLNLTEVILIPILVAFPIASFIFYQADRLAMAKVALAQQARQRTPKDADKRAESPGQKHVGDSHVGLCADRAGGHGPRTVP